jgi:hypothetical protein
VSKRSLRVISAGIALFIAACAPPVTQLPAQLTPGTGKSFRLTREVEADISTGRSTTLRANTRWELVGTVSLGEVYRTRDQVVTVRGDGVHEGYIVVREGVLVGFYLPVERAFCPVERNQQLSIEP